MSVLTSDYLSGGDGKLDGYIKVYTTKHGMLNLINHKTVFVKVEKDEQYKYEFTISLKDLIPITEFDSKDMGKKQIVVEILDLMK